MKRISPMKVVAISLPGFLLALCCIGLSKTTSPSPVQSTFDVKANYSKAEYQVPMRDGVKLFTSVYTPRNQSKSYPIMLNRTPYSVAPYGPDIYRRTVGPSAEMAQEGYVFVYQDVRGRYMSEGEFVQMRPQIDHKTDPKEIDESSDTYDTIDWLLKNIPNNNGRVGMWGISYPGFYTAVGIMQAHPALKAASPQAPIADWFVGDDFHHNGVLFFDDAFNFLALVGRPRPKPTTFSPPGIDFGPDRYKFLLDVGALPEVDEKYFKHDVAFWDDVMNHPNYDAFWQTRNTLPHLKDITPAVMTVGGWFDAEDLYGALHTYQAIEAANPKTFNVLVMGPWFHGGWSRGDGSMLGDINFGSKTAEYYRQNIELQFFNYYLKDKGELKLPEATVFNTGANEWKSYDHWPPRGTEQKALYLHANGKLSFEPENSAAHPYDEYVSDPNKPVPYTAAITNQRGVTYMDEDQRFAGMRPDVLVYESDVLSEDVTLAGPLRADLFVSSTGTDADFVVKLIDVLPINTPDNEPNPGQVHLGGYEMLVRGEVMRAKFRNSFEKPEALVPNKVAEVGFNLQDIDHTFRRGHKIMIQIQSSWFPLVDRNPQKFVDINKAKPADFQVATQRIYHAADRQSRLQVGVLK